jgi:hypothetical protein
VFQLEHISDLWLYERMFQLEHNCSFTGTLWKSRKSRKTTLKL